MSLLNAENVGLSFGDFDLFTNISLSIPRNQKIGLIGPNGVGKTSLLLILAGIEQPSSGKVYRGRDCRIGYLRQESMDAFADRENTVFGEMLTVFAGLRSQQEHLHGLELEMASGDYDDGLLETYGSLQETFERAGGYDFELRIQQTLQGLGLGKETWEMPLQHLSGGQKTRALLARLLLEKPELLMLDEPTNHLDIQAVEWLENTLRLWNGAVLIVSHDRFFLDNTVEKIWEMHPYGIEEFSGNYSAYLLQRQERWEFTQRVYKEEKARLLKEIDFVQRNWVRASTHARALGVLRKVSRELAIIENYGIMALRNGKKWHDFELRADRPLDVVEAIRMVNAIQTSDSRPPSIRPKLRVEQNSGNIVLRIEELSVGYPGKALFRAEEIELRRKACAALIGPNGSGKTTFIRVLLGEIEALQGEVRLGAGLRIGYLAQAQDQLDDGRSVLEELVSHQEMQPEQARSYLAQYLFKGEDVFTPVGALSGGERARLALAILSLEGANFLLLDEPTNHLDIPAQEALQEVLENFPGTILLVSHDRYLIDRLATQIWEIDDHRLETFTGHYREYLLSKNASLPASQGQKLLLSPKPLLRGDGRESRKKIEKISMLEERIRQQEKIVHQLSRELQKSGAPGDYEALHDISWKMAKAQSRLDDLLSEWEEIAV